MYAHITAYKYTYIHACILRHVQAKKHSIFIYITRTSDAINIIKKMFT